jgi:hypothetical protein
MTELTSTQLRRAAEIKDKIESLQAELKRLFSGNEAAVSTKPSAAAPKRQMSAAARAKISAAAKARWAKARADKK